MILQLNSAVDTGTVNTVTPAIDLQDGSFRYAWQVVQASGTITAAVTTAQISADGSTWTNTSNTVAAAGINDENATAFRFLRIKVTTKSTVGSTANIHVQVKST